MDAITESVDEFVQNSDKITQDALSKLENKIQQKIGVSSTQTKDKSTNGSNATSQNYDDSFNSSYNYNQTSNDNNSRNEKNNTNNNTTDSKIKIPANLQTKGVEWQVIATYDKVVGDEIEEKQKQKELQSRLLFKKSLDDHLLLAKQLHQATDGKDDMLYSQHVNKDVQKFYQEEEIKHKKLKEKELQIMRLRQEQIAEQKRLKEQEKLKDREFEVGIVKTALERLQIEKEITLDAKKRDRDIRMKIEIDNVENKKIIAKRQEIDRWEDQRLMAEYAAKLDK